MPDDKGITADDLAKIAATISILGYGIGLLALEKTSSDKKEQESMSRSLNHLFKRFK